MAVPISRTPTLSIGDPKLLYADLSVSMGTGQGYGPMPDGQRFLVIKEDPAFLTPRPEIPDWTALRVRYELPSS